MCPVQKNSVEEPSRRSLLFRFFRSCFDTLCKSVFLLATMAMLQAALKVEKTIGHGNDATIAQDITNPAFNPDAADPSGEKMKALAWMGKNSV